MKENDADTNYIPIDYKINKDLKKFNNEKNKNSFIKTVYWFFTIIFIVIFVLFIFYKKKSDRLSIEVENKILITDSLRQRTKILEIEINNFIKQKKYQTNNQK